MESVKNFNDCVKAIRTDDNIASPLRISVLTIGAELGSRIDLAHLFTKFNEKKEKRINRNIIRINTGLEPKKWKYENFTMKYRPEVKKTAKKEIVMRSNAGRSNKKQKKFFFNSLYIEFPYESKTPDPDGLYTKAKKINVKLFTNGKMGVTGSRSIEIAHEIPEIIFKFLKKFPKAILEPEKLSLKNKKINMINSNFRLSHPLKQQKLKDIVNDYRFDGKSGEWRIATFQPGKYAGVNCKYWTPGARDNYRKNVLSGKKVPKKLNGQVTVLVFRSGSASITGAKSSKELYEAYENITKIARNNQSELFTAV